MLQQYSEPGSVSAVCFWILSRFPAEHRYISVANISANSNLHQKRIDDAAETAFPCTSSFELLKSAWQKKRHHKIQLWFSFSQSAFLLLWKRKKRWWWRRGCGEKSLGLSCARVWGMHGSIWHPKRRLCQDPSKTHCCRRVLFYSTCKNTSEPRQASSACPPACLPASLALFFCNLSEPSEERSHPAAFRNMGSRER